MSTLDQSIPNSPTASLVLNRIAGDPTFKSFSSPDFDPAAFASLVVDSDSSAASTAAAAQAAAAGQVRRSRAELTMGEMSVYVGHIDGAIQQHVTDNRDQLLGGVGGIQELQSDCEALTAAVGEVKKSVQRIAKDLGEPFSAIQLRTEQLRRVHASGALLKRVLRVQMTCRKLRALEPMLALHLLPSVQDGTASEAQLAEVDLRELAKAAEALSEIQALVVFNSPQQGELSSSSSSSSLSATASAAEVAAGRQNSPSSSPAPPVDSMRGISVVEAEAPLVERIGQGVRLLAAAKLREGIAGLNQADVGGALQVFFNLGELGARVASAVASVVGRTADRISAALDANKLAALGCRSGDASHLNSGSASSSVKGSSAAVRDAEAAAKRQLRRRAREHSEDLANTLFDAALQVWNLQRVLAKKEDPRTHALFLHTVADHNAAQLCKEAQAAQAVGRNTGKHEDGNGSGDEAWLQTNGNNTSSPSTSAAAATAAPPLPLTIFWDEMVASLRTALNEALLLTADDEKQPQPAKAAQPPPPLHGSSSSQALGSLSSKSSAEKEKEATQKAAAAVLVELYPSLRKAFLDLLSRLHDATKVYGYGGHGDEGFEGGGGATEGGGAHAWSSASSSSYLSPDLAEQLRALDLLHENGERDVDDGEDGAVGCGDDIRIEGSALLFRPHIRSGLVLDSPEIVSTVTGVQRHSKPSRRAGGSSEKQQQQQQQRGNDGGALTRLFDWRGNDEGGGGFGWPAAQQLQQSSSGSSSSSSSGGPSLLRALSSVEHLFLARSLSCVIAPVEQMFPSVEGYTNAIPSKHDVNAFMAVVVAECERAVPPGGPSFGGGCGGSGGAGGCGGSGGGGGEASLAPLILKGVSKAVVYLSSRVEAMVFHSQAALAYGAPLSTNKATANYYAAAAATTNKAGHAGGSSSKLSKSGSGGEFGGGGGGVTWWAVTVEQEHNLQLLALVAKLYDSLQRLPDTLFVSPPPSSSSSVSSSSSALHANAQQQQQQQQLGGQFTEKGVASAAVAASSSSALAVGGSAAVERARVACFECLRPALKALESLARHQLLRPATAAMARALEAHLALMHRSHFGGGGGGGEGEEGTATAAAAAAAVDDDACDSGGSEYLAGFTEALSLLAANHLSRMPNHAHAPFVKRALAELASRLTRSFVSHASLVRPLTQKGRTRMTQDMALFEMALSPLLWPSTAAGTAASVADALGRSGQELHAFKNALFLEDDSESPATALRRLLNSDRDSSSSGGSSAAAAGSVSTGCGGSSGPVGSSSSSSALRPSTLIHHCFARGDCPATLSSPHHQLLEGGGTGGSVDDTGGDAVNGDNTAAATASPGASLASSSGSSMSSGGDPHTALVEWLVAGAPLPPACLYASVPPPPIMMTVGRGGGSEVLAELIPPESGAAREATAWAAVCVCLDTHAQRKSAAAATTTTNTKVGATVGSDAQKEDEFYEVLLEEGGALVERYLRSFVHARQTQQPPPQPQP